MNTDWDHKIREKLSRVEISPPATTWRALNARLPEQRNRSHRGYMIAATLTMLMVMSFFLAPDDQVRPMAELDTKAQIDSLERPVLIQTEEPLATEEQTQEMPEQIERKPEKSASQAKHKKDKKTKLSPLQPLVAEMPEPALIAPDQKPEPLDLPVFAEASTPVKQAAEAEESTGFSTLTAAATLLNGSSEERKSLLKDVASGLADMAGIKVENQAKDDENTFVLDLKFIRFSKTSKQ